MKVQGHILQNITKRSQSQTAQQLDGNNSKTTNPNVISGKNS